jgi:hypothetical protein
MNQYAVITQVTMEGATAVIKSGHRKAAFEPGGWPDSGETNSGKT